MVVPFYIIVACLPLMIFLEDDIAIGILLIALSAAIATGRSLVPMARQSLFRSVLTPLLCLLAVPACYLIFQLAPIPGISHPAWTSVAGALNARLNGAVTLDKGATFFSLARYGSLCGLLVLTMVVAMTHARAERVLVAILCCLTLTLTVYLLVCYHPSLSSTDRMVRIKDYSADAGFLACLGLILSMVLAIHLIGTYLKSKKSGVEISWQWFLLATSVSIALLSLIDFPKTPLVVALGIGCAAFLLVFLVRRVGVWAGGALAATACFAIIMLAGNSPAILSTTDATLRFGSQPATDLATVQRMFEDLPAFGTGAGTFDKLYQLYGVVDADTSRAIATTPFSAVMAVEFGKLAFWVGILAILAAVIFFLTCGVLRGRDWIYPAACASLLGLSIPLCFETPLRGHLNAFMLAAAVLGLGIAQSRSRHTDQ